MTQPPSRRNPSRSHRGIETFFLSLASFEAFNHVAPANPESKAPQVVWLRRFPFSAKKIVRANLHNGNQQRAQPSGSSPGLRKGEHGRDGQTVQDRRRTSIAHRTPRALPTCSCSPPGTIKRLWPRFNAYCAVVLPASMQWLQGTRNTSGYAEQHNVG